MKVECRVVVFKSVSDRDVADAAYRDVFTAVLKTTTRCSTATKSGQSFTELAHTYNLTASCITLHAMFS